jgi:hypothetical protein
MRRYAKGLRRLPRNVWVMSAVIGLIEGIAETTASLLQIFFGALMVLLAGVLFSRLVK